MSSEKKEMNDKEIIASSSKNNVKIISSKTENNDPSKDIQNLSPDKKKLNLNLLNLSNYIKNKALKSKKPSISINEDTLVYDLHFLSSDIKVKKIQYYEKILNELKKLFDNWDNKNFISYRKKINKEYEKNNNENNINNKEKNDKEDINKESNNNENKELKATSKNYDLFTIFDYIDIIKIPPSKRTMHDVFMVSNLLSNTKLGKYFKDEFDDNKEIYEKLITYCSVELQYKRYQKGQKIFNIGDLPDFFYIILYGKIDIVKPIQKKVEFTGNQYFCYLMNLKKNGDNYTYNLCLKNNTNQYFISYEEEYLMPYIYILINLEKINIDYQINFREVLSTVDIPPLKLALTERTASNNNFLRQNMKIIKNCLPYDITDDLLSKYDFIFDNKIKNEIIIYEQTKFLSLETNDYFGDSALDVKTTRNATIIASEDVDLGYLEMNSYIHNIGEEKSKLIKKKIKFLKKNFFFKKIDKTKFEKKYFGYFISTIYKKGDILFKENESPLFAYFIEEGKVELSSKQNPIEMEATIEALSEKRKDIINNEITTNKSNNNDDEKEDLLYSKLNSNFIDLKEYINKKENNKILILKKNEDIGIISFYFKCPYITDCTVVSNKAKIFKINSNYLTEILSNEPNCMSDLNKRVKHKLRLIHERFFNINNTKLLIADKKENYKLEERIKEQNDIKYNLILHKHDFINNKTLEETNEGKGTRINLSKLREMSKKTINNNNNEKNNYENSNEKLNKNIIKLVLPSMKLRKSSIFTNRINIKKKSLLETNWKNDTVNIHKIVNQSKSVLNSYIKNTNSVSFLDYNNNNTNKKINQNNLINNKDYLAERLKSNIFKSKSKSKQSSSNNSGIKKKAKNENYMDDFKKFFGSNNCLSMNNQIPLIFSKSIYNANANESNNINLKKNKIEDSNINFVRSNKNLNTNVDKFILIKSSRNYKSIINNNNSSSLYKYFKNANVKDASHKVFPLLKNNHFFSENNNSSFSIIPSTNRKEYSIKNERIISYDDKNNRHKIINKTKQFNHPYYSPAVLSKREKYKIFNNELYSSIYKENTDKMKDIKHNKNIKIFSFSSEKMNKIKNIKEKYKKLK